MKTTYVIDKSTGQLVEKRQVEVAHSPVIMGDLESFVSPIDGSLIDDRGKLRRHNQRYGVTDKRDYSDAYVQKRAETRHNDLTGNTPAAKAERIDLIKRSIAEVRGRRT